MRAYLPIALIVIIVGAALGHVTPTRAEGGPAAFYVVVHPDNPITSASRDYLADIFLKRTTRWPSDQVIRPVDLSPRSPIREEFTAEVLHRSVAAVKNYWQQLVFSGRDVPPPELEQDDDVVSYVAAHKSAIGYVSTHARLTGVKVIPVE